MRNAVLALGAWALATGCAIGTPLPAETDMSSLMPSPDLVPIVDAGPIPPSADVPNDRDAAMAMFVGDACERGATQACPCDGSEALGERVCIANAASPTGGALSECRGCPAAMPDAGVEDGSVGGASGMSGAGGASGMSGGTGGSAPTGGMSGGTSGMSGGTGGAPACACMDLLQCCRDDGSCGVGVPGLCL